MNATNNEIILENKSLDTLMLISVFGEEAYRRQARKELKNLQLICCPEDFGDDFMTNLDLIF
jgi:hypothetical protein